MIDGPLELAASLNPKVTVEQIGEDEGCKVYHLKMKMPLVISNRSLVTTFYRCESADGHNIIMNSSQGNESFVEARRDQIGRDVLATQHIGYISYKPYEGGIELRNLQCMDPAGLIPDFIKKSMGKRQARVLVHSVEYLVNGTVPPAPF